MRANWNGCFLIGVNLDRPANITQILFSSMFMEHNCSLQGLQKLIYILCFECFQKWNVYMIF